MRLTRYLLIFTLVAGFSAHTYADKHTYAIHDAHIHYDEDVWAALSPEDAVQLLISQNITRALVSATPTEGAEKLYRVNSEVIIPMLRPYKSWRHRYLWFKDPEIKAYLLEHLARVEYRGIGEFHVFGDDADTKQMQEIIELARERHLVLHPHTDLAGMKIILSKASDINVIWAHGGFDVSVEILRELLERYPKLYIELSFREGMVDEDGLLSGLWMSFLEKYSRRFLVGVDTYKPGRWADLPEIVAETRHWLNQLSADAAKSISRTNLDRLFPGNSRE